MYLWELCCLTSYLPCEVLLPDSNNHSFGCQPDEPQASLATNNSSVNVYYVLVFVLLFMYAVPHCLYSVGNKVTTSTADCPSVYDAARHKIYYSLKKTKTKTCADLCLSSIYHWTVKYLECLVHSVGTLQRSSYRLMELFLATTFWPICRIRLWSTVRV